MAVWLSVALSFLISLPLLKSAVSNMKIYIFSDIKYNTLIRTTKHEYNTL